MKDKSQSRLAPIDEDRRLIEDFLPIKEISEESAREKSIRHGHISTLHIWWARRPIVSARAAVFASLVKCPYDLSSKKKLDELLIQLCKWDNTNNNVIIRKAKEYIVESNGDKIPKVLDCFAGGGSIPLESARLGCETYAIDVNPVAYVIEQCTLYYAQKYGKSISDNLGFSKIKNKLSSDIEKWGKWVLSESKKEIGEFYPNDSEGNTPVAYLWARAIKCPNPSCQATIPLIKQYWLSKNEPKISLKPIVENKEIYFKVVVDKEIDFDPSDGTMKRGSVKCLCCNNTANGKYIKNEAQLGKMSQIMTCVVYNHPNKSGKSYRPATKKDLDIYNKAVNKLRSYKDIKLSAGSYELNLIPDELLPPEGSLGISPYWTNKKGEKRTWAELYNERQLLSLCTFLMKIREAHKLIAKEEINKEYADAVSTYLALTLGRAANYSSNLNIWSGDFVKGVFAMQIIQMVWDYCEASPFSTLSGNWLNNLKWVTLVVDEISKIDNPTIVKQGTATNIEYSDKYFDAIIIDPPYYDAVPYSDLSDFFYIWLKRCIGDIYPSQFSTPLTPKSKEIIQTSARHNGNKEIAKEWYENQMTLAFKECRRVLKDRGIFVVVFAHKTAAAWETLISSLLNSDLYVTASWPLHTERPGRTRSIESASLASSFFLACRERNTIEEGYFNEVKIDIKERISKKLDQFWSQGIRGADFFISAIGPAVEVFGKYKKIKKLSGEEVSVAELLDIVRQIVTDYSLHQILHDGKLGNIDDATRFYVLWRWSYADADVPFDDARKLAQALGAEPDELLSKKGLLNKKGDKVNMLEPWERKDEHLGEPKNGISAPRIDVIHKACVLWEKGNKKALTDFIERSGYAKDESIWNIAQAISEILPDGSKEKQLLQGLLNTKTTVQKEEFIKQTTLRVYKGDKK